MNNKDTEELVSNIHHFARLVAGGIEVPVSEQNDHVARDLKKMAIQAVDNHPRDFDQNVHPHMTKYEEHTIISHIMSECAQGLRSETRRGSPIVQAYFFKAAWILTQHEANLQADEVIRRANTQMNADPAAYAIT